MLTANIRHSVGDIRRDEWDALARSEDIQFCYEYQQYMEELDPRHRILVSAIGGASGSVNRSSSPESVRYLSVTSVVQRRLLTGDDTR